MSIIPGIEIAAPERTETRSGSPGSPKRLPVFSSSEVRCALDLGLEAVRELPAALRVRAARVGRDREAGRNGHAELGHLRQPDALAAEQVATSLGGLVEVVDEAVRGHAHQIFPQLSRLKATPSVTSGRPARRERATLAKRG